MYKDKEGSRRLKGSMNSFAILGKWDGFKGNNVLCLPSKLAERIGRMAEE